METRFYQSSADNTFNVAGQKLQAGVKATPTATKTAAAVPPAPTVNKNDPSYNFWQDMEGYDPNKEIFSDSSPETISQGSDAVRSQINGTKTSASETLNDINNADTATTIDELKKALGYKDPNAALTEEENQMVAGAEMEAFNDFIPLISEAEESMRMGMPKAVVGAGEKGGFESTQYAGAAALTPINAGTFVGKGGLLGEIKSGYERNIYDLKIKQQAAMKLARAKAIEAIKTGRAASNKEARELYNLAQEASDKIIERQNKLIDLTKKTREEGAAQIASIADSLTSVLSDDPAENQKMVLDVAEQYGVDPNVVMGVLNQKVRDIQKANIDEAEKITNILKDYPAGTKVPIGDSLYEAVGSAGDTQTWKEIDAAGNATFVTINRRTGKIVEAVSGGKIGKPQKGSSGTGSGFTPTELKKLEQAGLLNAPRQEQLDYLFGEDDDGDIY